MTLPPRSGFRPRPTRRSGCCSKGAKLRVDLGQVNGRVFVNTSGGGFIAEVSVAVTPQLKTIAGRLAYLIGGAQALLEFDPVMATVTLQPGDLRVTQGLYAFAVCNSRLIGGGRLIAPNAVIDDGLLDVCLIESMSALEFVALARKVAEGQHVADPRVSYFQASAVDIELAREINVNTDGEVFSVTRCEYRVLPRAARFFAGEAPFRGVRAIAARRRTRNSPASTSSRPPLVNDIAVGASIPAARNCTARRFSPLPS